MIDTVVFTQEIEPRNLDAKPGWKRSSANGTLLDGTKYQNVIWKHDETGLRIKFRPKLPARVEVSLSELLFGSNCLLIFSQNHIDKALRNADRLINQIGKATQPEKCFQRIDLVWQFFCEHQTTLWSHEGLLHPEIRKYAINYHWETLLWKGDELSISMYDKGLKEKDRKMKGRISRIEMRLQKKKLRLLLGNDNVVSKLSFSRCYQIYRKIMWSFSPTPVYRISKEFDLLYFAASEKWTIHDRPALDFLFRDLSTSRQRKKLRDVQRIRLEAYGLNWRKILPEDKPPKIKRVNDYDGTPCHSNRSPRTP